jgi:hypothetical protein
VLESAGPSSARAARFHHDLSAGGQRVDEPFELTAREPLALDDTTRPIRHRHLKDILCQVHRDRRSIHVGLLFIQLVEPKPSPRHIMP